MDPKNALDKRLPANRPCEATSRRPGQTLQDFFATENMAYADAVFIPSGLTDDQISHIFGFGVRSRSRRTIATSGSSSDSGGCTQIPRQTSGRGPTSRLQGVSGPIFTTSDGTCCNAHAHTPDVVSSSVQGWQQGQPRATAVGRREFSSR